MTHHPLSEGSFTIDRTKVFIPFDPLRDSLKDRPPGSLLVEVQPFVLKTSRDILLLDTGLGFTVDGVLQIHRNLHALGIEPRSITKVLLSHLHKDHAGGVAMGTGAERRLSFPQATYYGAAEELAFAFLKGVPSYQSEELAILLGHPQVKLTAREEIIDGYIHVGRSGGHCPFHQVFRIEEEGQIVFFGGDEAPEIDQMRHRFVAKYDHDGKRAMQLRQQWWEQGSNEKWTFLFYHDTQQPDWSA